MIMTDAGITAIEMTSRGPIRTVMSWLGLSPRPSEDTDMQFDPRSSDVAAEWSRQDALIAAQRAMQSAKIGAYDAAEAYFTDAFSLDRKLQPTQIANFWRLDLYGLEAAGRALLGAGRNDEAISLASEISFRHASHPERRLDRAAS